MSGGNCNEQPHNEDDIQQMEDDRRGHSRIWTAAEEGILKDSLQGYRDATAGTKGEFVQKRVVTRIKALEAAKHAPGALEKNKELKEAWKLKKKRIFDYMRNHGNRKRAIKIPGLNKKFTFTAVLREVRKDDILAEAKRLAGGEDSSPNRWLKYYQQARLNIHNALSEVEVDEIEALVDRWNQGSVPPEVQQRNAKANAKKILLEMNRLNFMSMGMRSVTLECHLAEDGTMRYSLTDTESLKLDKHNIPSWREFDPAAVAEMEASYKRYVKEILKILREPNAPAPADTLEYCGLTYHPGGLPRVPGPVSNIHGTETNKIRQVIVRDYIAKHYELAAGRKKTPYKAISENFSMFVSEEYWPRDVIFKEPSGYGTAETDAILRHFRQRQDKGLIPFRFNYVPIGKKNKVEIENYPEEIFNIGTMPLQTQPPAKKPRAGRRQKYTMRGDHSSDDSEQYNSDRDDQANQSDPAGESDEPEPGGDDIPPTPPLSQTETNSVRTRSESPAKRLFKRRSGVQSPLKKKGKAKTSTPAATKHPLTRARLRGEAAQKKGTRSQKKKS